MKNIFILSVVVLTYVISSCSTYNHSYRVSNIPEQDVNISDKIGVELKIDLTKVIRATSNKQGSVKDAKDEAYYKAIIDNQIHVLVDPIYSVQTSSKFLIFGGKSRASVIGFAGYYTNPKPMKQLEAENKAKKDQREQEAYERTVKEMESLVNNKIIDSRTTETSDISCFSCGTGDKAINSIEITKTSTKTSIVDEYLAFKKSMDVASSGESSDDKDSNVKVLGSNGESSSTAQKIKTPAFLKKILDKLMFFKKKK